MRGARKVSIQDGAGLMDSMPDSGQLGFGFEPSWCYHFDARMTQARSARASRPKCRIPSCFSMHNISLLSALVEKRLERSHSGEDLREISYRISNDASRYL